MSQREIKQAPETPYTWPKNAKPPKGKFFHDSRICFGIIYFDNEEDAKICADHVREKGSTYNGGFFHGMNCGREESRDFTDKETGTKWFAVTD